MIIHTGQLPCLHTGRGSESHTFAWIRLVGVFQRDGMPAHLPMTRNDLVQPLQPPSSHKRVEGGNQLKFIELRTFLERVAKEFPTTGFIHRRQADLRRCDMHQIDAGNELLEGLVPAGQIQLPVNGGLHQLFQGALLGHSRTSKPASSPSRTETITSKGRQQTSQSVVS